MYIDQSESNVGKMLSFKVGDYINKLETVSIAISTNDEEKRFSKSLWPHATSQRFRFFSSWIDLDEEESLQYSSTDVLYPSFSS